MGVYRRKPQTVEARQVRTDNLASLAHWTGGQVATIRNGNLTLHSLRVRRWEQQYAYVGQWLVRDADGRFTVMSDAEFRAEYEEIE